MLKKYKINFVKYGKFPLKVLSIFSFFYSTFQRLFSTNGDNQLAISQRDFASLFCDNWKDT